MSIMKILQSEPQRGTPKSLRLRSPEPFKHITQAQAEDGLYLAGAAGGVAGGYLGEAVEKGEVQAGGLVVFAFDLVEAAYGKDGGHVEVAAGQAEFAHGREGEAQVIGRERGDELPPGLYGGHVEAAVHAGGGVGDGEALQLHARGARDALLIAHEAVAKAPGVGRYGAVGGCVAYVLAYGEQEVGLAGGFPGLLGLFGRGGVGEGGAEREQQYKGPEGGAV